MNNSGRSADISAAHCLFTQARAFSCSTPDFGSSDSLLHGVVLCIVGCFVDIPCSTHQIPVAPYPQVVTIKNASRHCQMGEVAQNCSQLRNHWFRQLVFWGRDSLWGIYTGVFFFFFLECMLISDYKGSVGSQPSWEFIYSLVYSLVGEGGTTKLLTVDSQESSHLNASSRMCRDPGWTQKNVVQAQVA